MSRKNQNPVSELPPAAEKSQVKPRAKSQTQGKTAKAKSKAALATDADDRKPKRVARRASISSQKRADLPRTSTNNSFAIPYKVRRTKTWMELEELLTWQKATYGSEHQVVAATMLTMADYLQKQEVAAFHSQDLRDLAREIIGKEQLERFPFAFYRDLGREALTERRYERAERIFNSLRSSLLALNPNSHQMAQTLEFIAHTYASQDKFIEALSYQSQALTKYQIALGEEHINTIQCLGRFADLLWMHEDLEQALIVASWTRHLFQQVLGKDHQETIRARRRLKDLKLKMSTAHTVERADTIRRHVEEITVRAQKTKATRDLAKLKAKMESAVAENEEAASAAGEIAACAIAANSAPANQSKTSAEEMPEVFPGMDNQVSQFMWQKYMTAGQHALDARDYAEAERMYAVAVQKAHRFEANDKRLWESMCDLAAVYAAMGKLFQASKLFHETLDLCEKFMGSANPELVPFLYRLAQYYGLQGELLKEKQIVKRIIQIYADSGAPGYVCAPYEERLLELKLVLVD